MSRMMSDLVLRVVDGKLRALPVPAEVEVEVIDQLDTPVHDCEDDCGPCDRDGCGHLMCAHANFEDSCETCDCARFLADGDCPECNGAGEVTLENIFQGREKDVPCYECGGTGTTRPSAARWHR